MSGETLAGALKNHLAHTEIRREGTGLRLTLKRLIDIVLGLVAIALLAPLMLVLALLILVTSEGGIIYRHRRVGQGGAPFDCLKFRTMRHDANARLAELLRSDPAAAREWELRHKLTCDPRITPIGRFLRETSLDELPQLFSVVAGHMSLVGPRPVMAVEAQKYGAAYGHYVAMRPGITGLWQVSGRSQTSFADRVALDVRYVENWSLMSDLAILARTLPAVVFRTGAV